MEQRNSSRKSFIKGLGAACMGALLWAAPAKAAAGTRAEAAGAHPDWPLVRKSPRAVVRARLHASSGDTH